MAHRNCNHNPIHPMLYMLAGVIAGISVMLIAFKIQFGMPYSEFQAYHSECVSAVPEGVKCSPAFVVINEK